MQAAHDTPLVPLLPTEQLEREQRRRESATPELWKILDSVMDPEIPVLSIWELGVLQDVSQSGNKVRVTITPTYSGCPAMAAIAEDIEIALARHGHPECEVISQLSPAWTTDWMSAAARDKLRQFGIAPPVKTSPVSSMNDDDNQTIQCPRCGSEKVQRISEFGSTACKSLYRCDACAEPFDYFKTL